MDSLSNDLLLQMLDKQESNAKLLGEMNSDMKTMLRSQDEVKVSVSLVRGRVSKLERGNIKRLSFLAGVQFALTTVGIEVAKKLRWL